MSGKKRKIWKLREKLSINDFEKLKVLGRSALGKVYLVKLKNTKELYALKELSKFKMVQENKVQRVLTEREILSTTKHPFIVTYYHSFQNEDYLYIVMEYCEGGHFYDLLKKKKKLKEKHVKFYISEIVLALEYLHFLGFIYRDLKPENILISRSGHIRLSDFDLSKKIRPEQLTATTKRRELRELETNSFVGTEEYISPEVILGTGHSSLVDWWSLGIVTFELLIGQTPFKGFNMKSTFRNVLEGSFRFPSGTKISKQCKDFVEKCLEKKENRIGNKKGIEEVKGHPWLKNQKWSSILRSNPPYGERELRSLGVLGILE